MTPLGAWLSAFFVTELVEVPIYCAALRRADLRAGRTPNLVRHVAIAFGASALTHPIVWFLIPRIPYSNYWIMVVRAEAFAVLAEGLYFRMFKLERALAWSLLANGASVTVGFASRALIGWP